MSFLVHKKFKMIGRMKFVVLVIVFFSAILKNCVYILDVDKASEFILKLPVLNCSFDNDSSKFYYSKNEVYTYVDIGGRMIKVTYPGPPSRWVTQRNQSYIKWVSSKIGKYSKVSYTQDIGYSSPQVLNGMMEAGYNIMTLLIILLIGSMCLVGMS